jgi:streptomycin 6-kinase
MSGGIKIPEKFAEYQRKFNKEQADPWLATIPTMIDSYAEAWGLRLTGEAWHGMAALVLPGETGDGTPVVLKLQQPHEENLAEGMALRLWAGQGAVRLLNEDPLTGALLLERVKGRRDLLSVPDPLTATMIIAELLARLTSTQAPRGMRDLSDIAWQMLREIPVAAQKVPAEQAKLLMDWGSIVAEVADEPGNQLLHWDLHFENVLAAEREPWLAIDPKPLAGDAGFDLMPALHNRWPEVLASGDVTKAVLERFDLMTEVMGLDRDRAMRWTVARALQNALWSIADGDPIEQDQLDIAAAVRSRA